jgi:transcriptional regulator with XRE-family HTH domain
MIAVAKRREIDPEFGRRLRIIRTRAGLTLEALAERVGMAWTSIARLERGEREPTWGTAKQLADALGADMNEFRDCEGDQAATDQPDDDGPDQSTGKAK